MPNEDFSFVLKLKGNMKGVSNIRRLPDIEKIKTKSFGLLYGANFFAENKKGTFKFRITSKTPNFKTLYSFDLFDKKLKPSKGILFKDEITKQQFMDLIPKLLSNISVKKLKESTHVSKKFLSQHLCEDGLDIMQAVLGLLPIGLIILFNVIFYTQKFILWRREQIATKAEDEVNRQLFAGQAKDDSAFKIYSTLTHYVDLIIDKKIVSLIVCGSPGLSKTHIVRRTLHFAGLHSGKDYVIAKGGSISVLDTYSLFYKNRNKLIVLDDFDSPLKDDDMINMLKSVTDSYSRRVLSLPRSEQISSSQEQKAYDTPEKFEFNGRLVIITNLKKNDIDKAVLSRAPLVEVNFTTKELLDTIQKMIKYINPNIPLKYKNEVFDYIVDLQNEYPNMRVDFRTFKTATEVRYSLPHDWKQMVKSTMKMG